MGKGLTDDNVHYKTTYILIISYIICSTFPRLKPKSSHSQTSLQLGMQPEACDLGFTSQTYPGVT